MMEPDVVVVVEMLVGEDVRGISPAVDFDGLLQPGKAIMKPTNKTLPAKRPACRLSPGQSAVAPTLLSLEPGQTDRPASSHTGGWEVVPTGVEFR